MAEARESDQLIGDQKEDDIELDNMDKDTDNHTKGGETIHLTMAEARESDQLIADQKEDDIELDIMDKDKKTDIEWIRKNIKMRKCKHYVPRRRNDTICNCGYEFQQHSHINTDQANVSHTSEWQFEKNTDEYPTNAFGEIKFVNHGGNNGKFVRVDKLIGMSTMLELMRTKWKMEKPNLLISVTGSFADNIKKTYFLNMFQRQLMKAASRTGAWIITGNTHTTLSKCVGDAVKNYRLTSANQKSIYAICIAPWGVIKNRKSLEGDKGLWPAEYNMEDTSEAKEIYLDPHHSHYILVDDGTQHKFGTEFSFRAKLENEISKRNPADNNKDQISLGNVMSSVPKILLVLRGKPNTLSTVKNAIKENTPVFIIKGFGGAADILADAFSQCTVENVTKNVDSECDSSEHSAVKQIRKIPEEKIHMEMTKTRFCQPKDIEDKIQEIKDCLDRPYLIHIFEYNSGNSGRHLTKAMLETLLKANKNQMMEKLGLALAWNEFDIAKNEIVDNKLCIKDMDKTMFTLLAIEKNRANFVELFKEKGIAKFDLLKSNSLLTLYNQDKPICLIKSLFEKMRQKNNEGSNKKIAYQDVRQLMKDLLQGCYNESEQKVHATEDELFIWSVLNNRQEVAEFFWQNGRDHIASALVASALLSAISKRIQDRRLIEELTGNASAFTNLAIDILNEKRMTDEERVSCLLTQKSRLTNTSCIIIAMKTNNEQFISQTECLKLAKTIWNGALKEENPLWKLLLCTFVPVLIPRWIKFSMRNDVKPFHSDRNNRSSVQNPNINERSRADETNSGGHSQQIQGTKAVKSDNITKILSFYQAPVVVFWQNVIFNVVFLCLFSYILICKLEEKWSVEECVLTWWVFSILLIEIKQAYTAKSKYWKTWYIRDSWNMIDISTLLLFAIGIGLRSIHQPQMLEYSRIILGVDLVMFFIRTMQTFFFNKDLGPKLIMIYETIRSMIYFLVILMTVTVAYAVSSYAILYPNSELTLKTLIAIFRRPYWNIYGELMMDEIDGDEDCTNNPELYRNGTHSRCPTVSGKYFVPVLMGLYMLICNILLLNLLIVMFGNTYKKVQAKIDMYWNLQLLQLIDEYKSRPHLAPPLVLIEYAFMFILFLVGKCEKSNNRREINVAKILYRNQHSNSLQDNKLMKKNPQMSQQELIQVIEDDIAKLENRVDRLEEENENRVVRLMETIDKLQQQLKELPRKEDLENMLKHYAISLGLIAVWLITCKKQPFIPAYNYYQHFAAEIKMPAC